MGLRRVGGSCGRGQCESRSSRRARERSSRRQLSGATTATYVLEGVEVGVGVCVGVGVGVRVADAVTHADADAEGRCEGDL